MASKILADHEMQKASLILEFLKLAKDGIAKPHDPAAVISKLEMHEKRSNKDLTALKNCCSENPTVRDSKDFKPYIVSALEDLAEIMGWKVENY